MARDVHVLALIAVLVALGWGVMVPVLPVFAKSFQVSTFAAGAVVSAFAAMRLLTAPFCEPLNRRIGEKAALGAGIGIVAASTAAAGLAASYWQLLVMRALGGIGSAVFTVAAMVILLRVAPPDRRGRATALYSGGFLAGSMAGPAVGGLLSELSLTAPFFFYAASLVVAGAVGMVLLSPTRPATPTEPVIEVLPMAAALADRRYLVSCLANFAVGWQSQGVRSTLVPLIIVEVLLLEPRWTGIAFAVAAVAQGLALGPVGRAVDLLGRGPLLVAGGLICALGSVLIALAPSLLWLTVILSGYGIGSAMLSTAPTALVGDVLAGRAGRPVAVFQMTADAGAIAGPLAAGALADHWSMIVPFSLGATLCATAAGCALTLSRQHRPGESR